MYVCYVCYLYLHLYSGICDCLLVLPAGRILVGLDKELYLHEPVKKKIKFQSSGAEVAPECRVMSLTSFSLLEVFRQSDVCHSHYVAAGCSDGVIR